MGHGGGRQAGAEAAAGGEQGIEIGMKIAWNRATLALFDFRTGGHPFWPPHGHVQSELFEEGFGDGGGSRTGDPFSQRDLVGVTHMTDHLVNGHAAPESLIFRRQPAKPLQDLLLVVGFAKRLHFAATRWQSERILPAIESEEKLVERPAASHQM